MERSLRAPLTLGLMLVFAVACQRTHTAATQAGTHGDDRILTRERLLSGGGAPNVYDAIARVRPQCLQARTSGNPARRIKTDSTSETGTSEAVYNSATRSMTLYVDGTRTGTADDLRTMSIADVMQVECLTASDAAQRFGLNNVAGAIVVKTGRP